MPLWLQLVGTGITTAFTAHLGAVLPAAQWPAITCLNTYRDDLIREPLEIRRGHMRVPEAPGLGVEGWMRTRWTGCADRTSRSTNCPA